MAALQKKNNYEDQYQDYKTAEHLREMEGMKRLTRTAILIVLIIVGLPTACSIYQISNPAPVVAVAK